ncbi:TetR/AcrR family transcriptional regulator [Blautia sp. RD014234]|nr:TetR/AcrR family transcriptional regulator [Blautia parvula]
MVKGDGVSMRGIARECGIAVGSIYNYFPTKNDR